MATPKPKYVAAVDFNIGPKFRYRAGQAVPAGVALESALRFGDKFVTLAKEKPSIESTGATPPTPPADSAPSKE